MLARRVILAALLACSASGAARAQDFIRYDRFESERSDRLTGGRVERAEFEPGNPDIRLTLNVPSFRLTLWQGDREVKSYWVGVGMKDYPIYIGEREATQVIWNPAWIPPASDWVSKRGGVRPGEVIKASDPRNPLGKVKIPLGDAYLIHQAAKTTDLGSLVSHGCVRMLRSDLYDLAEKINAAHSYPVSPKRIAAAKRGSRQLVAQLPEPVPVDINYDTLVVENGVLHIYPDVYDRRTNTVARLRAELESSGVSASALDDDTLKTMLDSVKPRTQFVVEVSSIERGSALADGRTESVLPRPARPPAKRRVRAAAGR
ncbi:MAG TPA: L,D-transpeptidase [Pyrinomonadaceae bacterium]|nr:L,D-transpeptidase [Pyrinomonadaceae bacterium]